MRLTRPAVAATLGPACWALFALLPPVQGPGRAGPSATPPRNSQDDGDAPVDQLLDRLLSKTGPGLAVMVIRDHVPIYKRGYGLARLDPLNPVSITSTTNFRLASMSKQFTGMAVAMLIEKGQLKLDDRLTDFFPDQPAREVRLCHLLHHTAGLPEYATLFLESGTIDTDEYQSAPPAKPGFEPTNADILTLLKTQRLLHYPPGRVYEYSNTGYACLAAIIEKRTGLKYGEFLCRCIFKPLGMSHTFVAGNPRRDTPDLAYSYDFRGAVRRMNLDYSRLNRINGDDGVYSNLEDLCKWDQALLHAADQKPPAKPLVKDETLDLIFRPGRLNDGSSTGYGFGWAVGDEFVDHDGAWLGFRTYIRRQLNEQFTVIVLSNYAVVDAAEIGKAVYEIYHPAVKRNKPGPAPSRAGKRTRSRH